jgi:single-strand selective monofunctional uracil DNA glycosylase
VGERKRILSRDENVVRRLERAADLLQREVARLSFAAPVTHVYDPLDYARAAHRAYLRTYATTRKRVLFLGMNPGPFGMAQTGVPFGEVGHVREWLGIFAPIGHPPRMHARRPVLGFACERSEVSGARLWGAIRKHFATPERFFAEHFVANYCPLLFLEASGRNRTPDKLPRAEREPLFAACDRHLVRVALALEPEWVIGIGGFAAARARAALSGSRARIACLLHPSPANPRANRAWEDEARSTLRRLGVCSASRRSCA